MRLILDWARVWENCALFVLSLRRACVWGSDSGCRCLNESKKGTKEQKSRCTYSISLLVFVSLIHIDIFSFFQPILSTFLSFFFSWFFPASSWTGPSSEHLSPCLLCYGERGSWVIPPEKISEMFRVHTGPLCYLLLMNILIQQVYWVWRNVLPDSLPLLSFCRPFLLE